MINNYFATHKKSKRYVKLVFDLFGYSRKRRRQFAMTYYRAKLDNLQKWSKLKTENYNFYYELTDRNLSDLTHLIASITNKSFQEIHGYMNELQNDAALRKHISSIFENDPEMRDATVGFGRRYGWYAIIRAIKPKMVLETGVHQGVGAVLICRALILNSAEGSLGNYIGVDIDPKAGILLKDEYATKGEVIFSDAIQAIDALTEKIDMFISDSDHDNTYELMEYEHIRNKLAPGAIILADNSHATRALADFSLESHRNFIFFREEPQDHWYPGAGIGISFENSDR